ncbi:MAG: hypothetical protein JXR96_01965 [Deltaproteobacteria bacterium]|nr:hypothetical protein [Deltaproteobacteria bacterium]
MSDDRLLVVAERLAGVLGEQCVLIGGLAVAAWGHVRATRDVGFASRVDASLIRERLAKAGIPNELRTGDPFGGDLEWVVHGTLDEVPFEILAPPMPVDWDAASEIDMPDGCVIRLVGLRDLLRLKIGAGGPRDLWDVASLLKSYPEERDVALSEAERQGRREALIEWLNDPRL